MSRYPSYRLLTSLDQEGLFARLSELMPGVEWRRGSSGIQGALTVRGVLTQGCSVKFWFYDDEPGEVTAQIGELNDVEFDSEPVEHFLSQTLPLLGRVVSPGNASLSEMDSDYRRQGNGEYFENAIADCWDRPWWGWWGFAMKHLDIEVSFDNLPQFQDAAASPDLRREVVEYLRATKVALAGQQPKTKCTHCDVELDTASFQWDGMFMWSLMLPHEVEAHGYVVPNRLIDRIRHFGTPPDRELPAEINDYPWPEVDEA